ncbi:MAG: UDP-glucose 4-epimerase GalE [Verrucomicrobiota bacterium JB023]|nr:UDP-glucose 4-epimerase GalE [Verrucomicrobiota bacterium JB023]
MKLLVTGGAGYIGSHTVRELVSAGHEVIVLDNLVYGHREALIDDGVQLYEGDLGDQDFVRQIFTEHAIEAVIHFAAYAYVGESVHEPLKYYQNNLAAPLNLLTVMKEYDCKRFIFSSTCATYGVPATIPISENESQEPINPYGQSKLMLEQVLKDCDAAWGLKSVFLRYFNASGASLDGKIGEAHDPETHLIPRVLMAIRGEIPQVDVFGTDYDTPDGTCIRDYIHVIDLADAHLRALDFLQREQVSDYFNLGTGHGISVKAILEAAEKVSGKTVPVVYGDRREGDPPRLIADASKAKEKLGWVAKHSDVDQILQTAWNWDGNFGK